MVAESVSTSHAERAAQSRITVCIRMEVCDENNGVCKFVIKFLKEKCYDIHGKFHVNKTALQIKGFKDMSEISKHLFY